jgi:hypothetical protein
MIPARTERSVAAPLRSIPEFRNNRNVDGLRFGHVGDLTRRRALCILVSQQHRSRERRHVTRQAFIRSRGRLEIIEPDRSNR